MEGMELKEKETRKNFKDKVKELVNKLKEMICWIRLRMGFSRFVKNFVERENKREQESTWY